MPPGEHDAGAEPQPILDTLMPITTDVLTSSPISGSANGDGDEKQNGEVSGEEDDDDEGEDEDEEESEEEDEDDEEPTLKYEKLQEDASRLLEGKDSASALAASSQAIILGTHAGIVHVLDFAGVRQKSYRSHTASILDLCVDATGDFVGSASVDGQVVVNSLSTTEVYSHDFRRPMRAISLEPNFAKRTSRAWVSGGMAGNLVLHEKGWLGHKETVIHTGEGPIWNVRWKSNFIAWANDLGVKIYDTTSQQRITYIDRPQESPRADLFKCTLHWQDDTTLLIGWADHIKVARIRNRVRTPSTPAGMPPFSVEIIAFFQVDCMISGIIPHHMPASPNEDKEIKSDTQVETSGASTSTNDKNRITPPVPPALNSFLILSYIPPDTFENEATLDRAEQRRKAANRPEIRVIARSGEELASDALTLNGYHMFGCNDYSMAEAGGPLEDPRKQFYVVMSPRTIIVVRMRDRLDHVRWLVQRRRYADALKTVDEMDPLMVANGVDKTAIGREYLEYLVEQGDFENAAKLCPEVLKDDASAWEHWIFTFAQRQHLQLIIPYVPTQSPQLSRLVYEMIIAHFLKFDREALLRTVKTWPSTIYDINAVIVAVQSELDKATSKGSLGSGVSEAKILMECLAELYIANHQPGQALPYYLRLRRPNVFDLIREHNLFTAVQNQALLLVEFDQELIERRKEAEIKKGDAAAYTAEESKAIRLLVDHTHSITIARVVPQLQSRPYYLYLYLDALFTKDPHLAPEFADLQVQLYADYATTRLVDFLRASNYYSLESAYRICNDRDLVPEMVFLLGRMGDNKRALNLIIERLGDVNRAIDFAKEQNDHDLWEDLLRYSETKPAFIRGLLENVTTEIDPIRIIRRIRNGLEIPGLKEALIKILQDFNLQVSLLGGCQRVLISDVTGFAKVLQRKQGNGFFLSGSANCPVCNLPLQQSGVALLFLCRHVVHASCASGGGGLPPRQQTDSALLTAGSNQNVSAKITFASMLRARMDHGCPVCFKSEEGDTTTAPYRPPLLANANSHPHSHHAHRRPRVS